MVLRGVRWWGRNRLEQWFYKRWRSCWVWSAGMCENWLSNRFSSSNLCRTICFYDGLRTSTFWQLYLHSDNQHNCQVLVAQNHTHTHTPFTTVARNRDPSKAPKNKKEKQFFFSTFFSVSVKCSTLNIDGVAKLPRNHVEYIFYSMCVCVLCLTGRFVVGSSSLSMERRCGEIWIQLKGYQFSPIDGV